MTSLVSSTAAVPERAASAGLSPQATRLLLVAAIAGAAALAYLATGHDAMVRSATAAGADFTRLLRAMALLKATMAAGLVAAILWRLGAAATVLWLAAYATAAGAMAAGPVLIWGMVHVGLGALLLHGGLLAVVLLLWRDPAVGARLAAIVAARRAAMADREAAQR